MGSNGGWRSGAVTALVVGVCLLILVVVDEARVAMATTALGGWGPAFLLFFLALTQILAPLPAGPGMLVALKLYGFDQALGLYAVASLVSAMVNFQLARWYGRPLVARLVGPEKLALVDRLSVADERLLLVVSRTFGFAFFDLISYAIGLTRIGFRRYLGFTVGCSLLPLSVQYLLFRDFDLHSPGGVALFFVSVLVMGGVFSWLFFRLLGRSERAGRRDS